MSNKIFFHVSVGLVSGFPEDFEEKLKEISDNWGTPLDILLF